MMPFTHKRLMVLIMVMAVVGLAGCGRLATPVAEVQPTRGAVTLAPVVAQAISQAGEAAEVEPVETDSPTLLPPTDVPPTDTPVPTAVPPTATPVPTDTPTPIPPTEAAVGGSVANGEVLFNNGKDASPACTTCHLVEQDAVLIGPSMLGLADRAAQRVEGLSAEEYLAQSIVQPNAYLVPDTDTNIFAAGGTSLMFQQYSDYLTESDVDDLVAYILSLP